MNYFCHLIFSRTNLERFRAALTVGAGFLGVTIGIYLWGIQFVNSTSSIKTKYGKFNWYSDSCEVAVAREDHLPNDEDIFSRQLAYEHMRVPMRLEGAPKIRLKSGEMIITKCIVDLTVLRESPEPWLTFGLISGKSTIFINKVAVFYGHNSPSPALFLRQDELRTNTEIVIVARRQGNQNPVGLTGAVPLMYGYGKGNLTTIQAYWNIYAVESPLVRLGVTTTMILFFCSIWLRGIRYPDVEWIIFATFALSLFPLLQKLAESGFMFSQSFQYTLIYWLEAVTIGGFVIAFTRVKNLIRVYSYLGVFLLLVGVPVYTVLDAKFLFKPMTNFMLSMAWLMGIFLAVMALNLQKLRKMGVNRRFRLYTIATMCGIGSICYGVQVYLLFSKVILLAPFINFGIAIVFSVFLMSDLAINRNEIQAEKEQKVVSERELAGIRRQLLIAQNVQQALLPDIAEGKLNKMTYQFIYEPFDTIAGDWIVEGKFKGGDLFLLGDITGKGPAAAFAMAAVTGMARSAMRDAKNLDGVIKNLSDSMCEIFSETTATTLAAIYVDQDSTIKVCAFGTPPIIAMSFGARISINPTNGFIGITKDINISWTTVKSTQGDFLVYLSDGFIDGSRELKAFSNFLTASKIDGGARQLAQKINQYVCLRDKKVTDDRSGFVLAS